MIISPFQALTILADKYKGDEAKLNKIKQVYLVGSSNPKNDKIMKELLADPLLRQYTVSFDSDVISNCPVRRYFESHLCAETLKVSLDKLDESLIKKHFKLTFKKMPRYLRLIVPRVIYTDKHINRAKKISVTAPEYIQVLQMLADKESFTFLKTEGEFHEAADLTLAERKAKMAVLVKTAHAAMTAVNKLGKGKSMPLDLYKQENSPYSPEKRGRVGRQLEVDGEVIPQDAHSHALGIMRNNMALPQDDALVSRNPSGYLRPADASKHVNGAQMPEKMFATGVTPFVNSISGTMLCQLRVIAKLLEEKKFVYKNDPEQLQLFITCLVATMIFNSGGHSLQEFLSVLDLPEVKKEFRKVPGFDKCNVKTLFQTKNEDAFDKAMASTIGYNNTLLPRKSVLQEIEAHGDDIRKILKPVGTRPIKRIAKTMSFDDAYAILKDNSIPDSSIRKERAKKAILKLKGYGKKPTSFQGTQEDYDAQKLNEIINKTRDSKFKEFFVYGVHGVTINQHIDKAFLIMTDKKSPLINREAAAKYLAYIFDIADKEEDAIKSKIVIAMQKRRKYIYKNPNYIPGMAVISKDVLSVTKRAKIKKTERFCESDDDEITAALRDQIILDVNNRSKRKDAGLAQKPKKSYFARKNKVHPQKTIFCTDIDKHDFDMRIHKGLFWQNGELVDTSDSLSHGKKGFAAFTIDADGVMSIFQHIDHDKTGIAHSSMTGGKPVIYAGEIKIENGKLVAITDHSGHYRPSLFNLYNFVSYLERRNVKINNVELLTFSNPAKALEISTARSKKHPKFYSTNADSFVHSYKAKLRIDLLNARKDLNKYRNSRRKGFNKLLHKLFDTEYKYKMQHAKVFDQYLISQEKEIEAIKNIEQLKDFIANNIEHSSEVHNAINSKHSSLVKLSSSYSKHLQLRAKEFDIQGDIHQENLELLKNVGRKRNLD